MKLKENISNKAIEKIAKAYEIDWETSKFDIDQFRKGIEVEFEHLLTVDNGDIFQIARIALDHLEEIPDYYDRLDKMEREAGIEEMVISFDVRVGDRILEAGDRIRVIRGLQEMPVTKKKKTAGRPTTTKKKAVVRKKPSATVDHETGVYGRQLKNAIKTPWGMVGIGTQFTGNNNKVPATWEVYDIRAVKGPQFNKAMKQSVTARKKAGGSTKGGLVIYTRAITGPKKEIKYNIRNPKALKTKGGGSFYYVLSQGIIKLK